VDEANAVYDATKSQWNMVMGSSLDVFSIRRSPAGATYNEDALFFINGSTGRVGIATVDTGNGAAIPFTPQARLDVQTASGDAVRGTSTGAGSGVFGYASATTGNNFGVYGQSNSTVGSGMVGFAIATTGSNFGVYGYTSSPSGRGVYGLAAATTGTNYGVYGWTNSPSGYAGYFSGNVNVIGTLSKLAGGFRIDHPLDPAQRYLNHSFVESPDMKDLYDGVVTLDDAGQAWVDLPDWFEALNQEFRYQLTPIGASMPDLYIAQGVQHNRFRIGGGVPGMQVSWQVTGIRHDPYAEAHRILVEEDKPAEERGTYLYPELYGEPAELAAPQLQVPLAEPASIEGP